MKASIQGRTTCAKILLLAGASPFKRDSGRGLCALEWAEYCNRQQCATTLKQYMNIYPVDIRRFAIEDEDDGKNFSTLFEIIFFRPIHATLNFPQQSTKTFKRAF